MKNTKKKIISLLLTTVMFLAMGMQVFAAEVSQDLNESDSNIADVESSVARAQGDYTVLSCRVYPAKCTLKKIFTPYTDLIGTGQWCNGTLSTASANAYSENNCDGFYVQVKMNPGSAKTYKMYINDTFVQQGSVPSQTGQLSMYVKNNNPGRWKIVLYEYGDTTGIPVWGRISVD